MDEQTYAEKLSAEAELWGSEAEKMAEAIPPEWRYHRHLRHNVILHHTFVEALLAYIRPGMHVLELGCASGWLTLAMAQQGAEATGVDLSEKSLTIARAYYESIRDTVKGTVNYRAADLNAIELPPDTYDVVVVKGVLHHLIRCDHIVQQIYDALKPGGMLWVEDTHGEEVLSTVLTAGALTLILPTQVSYGEKIRALFRFGLHAPSRVKASIEADGLSPFEGAGRDQSWLDSIHKRFQIERQINHPAVTGYITAQLRGPDWFALPLLKGLRTVDRFLVRLGLLKNTGVVICARKQG